MAAAFSWEFYREVPVLREGVAAAFGAVGTATALLVLLLAGAGAVLAARRGRPLARTAALGVAAFVPLWFLWDAGNVEHVVGAVPLLVILAALAAARLPGRWGPALLLAAAAALGTINGLGSAIPASRPANSRVMVVADFVNRTVPPDGLLLSAGTDPRLRLGLPYLSGRRVRSLALLLDAASRAGADPAAALRAWLDDAEAARELWVTADVFDPQTLRWVGARGIPAESWNRAVARFRREGEAVLPPDGVVLHRPVVLYRARVQGP